MNRCQKCGAEISIGASDCAKCGSDLDGRSALLVNESNEPKPTSTGSLKVLFGVLLVFWVILFYAYAFSATAHGRKGLPAILELPIGLLQIAYPIIYLGSLFSKERRIVLLPGWILLAQIVSIFLVFVSA